MSIEDRVESLLQQLTLKEKISLLSGQDPWNTVPIPRLGIPSLTMSDGPHGVRSSQPEAGRKAELTTAFPTGIAMASSWNTELVEEVGEALAVETLGMDCDILLGPCVNIVRHPLAGRNFETFGEDPYLAGRVGAAWVKGLQKQGVGASLKHFACNNQEIERNRSSSEVDERTLREIYLAQFEQVVKETQPWTVMCSYNRINGIHASQHHHLQNEILKDEWGFEGVIVSDWGANHTIVESIQGGLDLEMPGPAKYYGRLLMDAVHLWQVDEEVVDQAARRMLRMIVRSGRMDGPRPAGKINPPEHQQLARRVAEESITLLKNEGSILPFNKGELKNLAVIGPAADQVVISGGGSAYVLPPYRVQPLQGLREVFGEQTDIVYEPGCDNYVELPVIPLALLSQPGEGGGNGLRAEYFGNPGLEGKPDIVQTDRKIDFWWFSRGPHGDSNYSVRWSGKLTAPGTGQYTLKVFHSDSCRLYLDGNLLIDSQAPLRDEFMLVKPSAVLQMQAGQAYDLVMEFLKPGDRPVAAVSLHFGFTPDPAEDDRLERAVLAAQQAEAVVVFIGNPENYETEGTDRPDIELPGVQNALVEAVVRANPRTVVVLNTGAPVRIPWIDEVPAVVQMHYPGMEAGRAIARILTGDANPSGKLAATYPRRLEDNPAFGNCCVPEARSVLYGEGVFVGYRHYEYRRIEPLFPFGHGLSYTQFEYSDLQAPRIVRPGEDLRVSLVVKNKGERAGMEVVQLYIRDAQASVPRPVKELKGFQKVSLEPGESQTVSFTLDERALSFYDPVRRAWVAEPGEFVVLVGSSSADIHLQQAFELADG